MELATILQAILLTAAKPLSLEQLESYFLPEEGISRGAIRQALEALQTASAEQSFELKETASGFRLQTRAQFQPWVQRHDEERPQKYSRAFLETLALIAWRQPITRAEIEEVRGVAVNTNVIKTLLERDWVKVIGHKEVPGRPEMLGTTRHFLDYFNLKSLDDLPSLVEMQALDVDELTQKASPLLSLT
ncbi:MAG: SMC-Scp complex subunit ScpB [Candidatus Thiothrix putei]|uniref:SMC-Scp complex subunit ScpB n=1 Tax=Candidatus Thiothrix putei TaxID=3080811 RepID=A0AA95HEJ9_9GAMM|nr:MAG: SMC-Scp complex subunit ScpB [Candidatus Thiothrix putei]